MDTKHALTGPVDVARVAAFNWVTQNQLKRTKLWQAMDDEKYYQIVADELRGNRINDALWTKAIAKSQGDENKTKATYIQLRVEQIMLEERQSRVTKAPAETDELDEPNEVSEASPSEAQKIIQWIVAGVLIVIILYVGKNWVWPKFESYF